CAPSRVAENHAHSGAAARARIPKKAEARKPRGITRHHSGDALDRRAAARSGRPHHAWPLGGRPHSWEAEAHRARHLGGTYHTLYPSGPAQRERCDIGANSLCERTQIVTERDHEDTDL